MGGGVSSNTSFEIRSIKDTLQKYCSVKNNKICKSAEINIRKHKNEHLVNSWSEFKTCINDVSLTLSKLKWFDSCEHNITRNRNSTEITRRTNRKRNNKIFIWQFIGWTVKSLTIFWDLFCLGPQCVLRPQLQIICCYIARYYVRK